MTTATRPVGCSLPSIAVKTPCLPRAYGPCRAGHVPLLPGGGRPCRLPCDAASAGRGGARAPVEQGEKRARAALRTGVHPVGHETGPVVYWVPGPLFKSSHRLPGAPPAAQPGAGLRSNLGVPRWPCQPRPSRPARPGAHGAGPCSRPGRRRYDEAVPGEGQNDSGVRRAATMRLPCGGATELAEYHAACPYPQICTPFPPDRTAARATESRGPRGHRGVPGGSSPQASTQRLRPAPERSG